MTLPRAYPSGDGGLGLPDLSTTEIVSGRTVNGEVTYLKMVVQSGNLSTGVNSIAHGITGLARVVSMYGSACAAALGQCIPLPYAFPGSTYNVELNYTDATNIKIAVGSSWTSGAVLSNAWVQIEYTKS